MIFPIITNTQRPNRLEGKKDEKYHADFARFCIQSAYNPVVQYNIYKFLVNYNFYKDNQWIFNEDLEPFLKDESGDVRNRVRWEYNIIRPIVEHYVGNVVKTDFTVRAYNCSPESIEKKDAEIAQRLTAQQMAANMPLVADNLKQQFRLGDTPEETELMFDEEWVDESEVAVNGLLRHVETINRFDVLKVELMKNKILGGISIAKETFQNGEQCWQNTDIPYFYFDVGARQPDLSDAEHMGDYSMMLPTEIYERWTGLTWDERDAIQRYCNSNSQTVALEDYGRIFGQLSGRVPVFDSYWHDTEQRVYGYVLDDAGRKFFTCLEDRNYKPESPEEIYYTERDAVPYKQLTPREQKKVTKDGTTVRFMDIPHYCTMIPKEILGYETDIVLEYGAVPFSERYSDAPFVSHLPYKVDTYNYRYGEIVSPLDSIIKPQRIINRCLSMAEAMLNNSRGANYFVDKSLVSTMDGGEAGMQRNMNQSKPVLVDGSRYGGNIQNAVIPYDATGIKDASGYISIIQSMREMTQTVTGINDNMTGLANGSKQLVGVQQSNIVHGSLLQEPIYNGISVQFEAIYKCIANKGRQFYCDNERKLTMLLGEKGMREIMMTRDMMTEEFRIELRRVSPDQSNIEAQNTQLITFLQMQLIGEEEFAKLYNRAEADEVAFAIREYSIKKQQMAKAAQEQQDASAQQQQAQNEQMIAGAQQEKAADTQVIQDEKQKDRDAKFRGDQMKEIGKLMQHRMKNNRYPI